MSLEKRSSVILCPKSVEGPGKCTLMSRDEKPRTFKNAFKIPDHREKRALVCCQQKPELEKEELCPGNLVNFLFGFTHLFFINHLLLSLAHLLITIVSGEGLGREVDQGQPKGKEAHSTLPRTQTTAAQKLHG